MDGMKALKAQSAYSRPERPTNFITYVLAAGLSFVGLVFLLLKAVPLGEKAIIGATVFGAMLVAVFVVGAFSHILPFGTAQTVLSRVENNAEVLFVAGMFAAIALTVFCGGTYADMVWGYVLLAAVAACAVSACVVNVVRSEKKLAVLALYVATGILCVVRIARLTELAGLPVFWLSVGGGIMYAVGRVFGGWDALPFRHTARHLFTMCGATLHFVCLYLFLL